MASHVPRRRHSLRSLIKLAIVGALAWGAWTYLQRPGCGTAGAVACPPAALEEGVGVELSRAQVCPGAGYFCHELRGEFPVARWTLEKGKLKVRIPLPEFADPGFARELQDAAIEGVMGWDNHPFPLVLDTGKRTPLFGYDVGLHWYQGQGGGHARVGLNVNGKRLAFSIDGLQVRVPPVRQEVAADMSPEQVMEVALAAMKAGGMGTMSRDQVLALVKATASHEMGHALGLMHSDSERDIMYPQYTPGATPDTPSGRDLRTVEALYALPNGAAVR